MQKNDKESGSNAEEELKSNISSGAFILTSMAIKKKHTEYVKYVMCIHSSLINAEKHEDTA